MNNYSKILELNKRLLLRKFELFYNKNKKDPFNKEKLYKYLDKDIKFNFSIYVEYLIYIKDKIYDQPN